MKGNNAIFATVIALLVTFIVVYDVNAKVVTIIDGDRKAKMVTFQKDVDKLLEEAEIQLGEADKVMPDIKAPLRENMEIVIKRAVPVWLAVEGKEQRYMSAADTVKDVLEELDIQVGEEDIVTPRPSTPVKEGIHIKVVRVTHKIEVNEREIPYKTVIRDNNSMYKGIEKVLKKGYNGKVREEIRVTYHDGKEVDREIVDSKIIKEPQDEIVERGTKDSLITSRGEVRFKKAMYMVSTAYSATYEDTGKKPGEEGFGITRSGTRVRPGVVAVDPRVIPLGTKLYIKSLDGTSDYGFASAEDTGGAIKGNKIDLYFESPADAKKYGRRKVLVYILE